MCQFKSAIILKDRIFIPDYDSHTEMLEELGIADTTENAERLFVRAELIPANNDVFSDIDTWIFHVDQDIQPEWFVAEYEKQRMIQAVKGWAKTHIHIGIDNLKIDSGKGHYIEDCKNVEICGSATVNYIYGSATVNNICDSATVKNIYGSATVNNICDSATVKNICDSATVKNIYGSATVNNICDSATVENIYGSATVKNICGSATVNYIYGSATVNNICDSATVENIYGSATVNYIYGSATVKNIYGSATVDYIYDSATVKNICDSATVENIYDSATVKNICDSATVENIYGSATVNNICDSATVERAKGCSIIATSKYYKWRNQEKLLLLENATLKDNYGKAIYQSGDYKLISVTDGKIS